MYDCGFFLIAIYRPPSTSMVENDNLISFLLEFCSNKEVVILGDLNLPTLKWDLDNMFSNYISPVDRLFLDLFTNLGLTQLIDVPTIYPSGNILDLFLTNAPDRVGDCLVLPPLPSCNHCPIIVNYVFQFQTADSRDPNLDSCDRLWFRGNYDLLARVLSQIDWFDEFFGLNADQQYKMLLNILKPLINSFIPKRQQVKNSKLPWPVNPPNGLLRAKNSAWLEYKLSRHMNGRNAPNTLESWTAFQDINKQVRGFAAASQCSYESMVAAQVDTNPKLFHSYLNHKKVGRPSVGPLKLNNGTLTDDPFTMAENFVGAFSSVFECRVPDNVETNQICTDTLDNILVTPQALEKMIGRLDVSSSMGGDGIHPKFLKSLSSELSVPLSIICNTSRAAESNGKSPTPTP